MKKRKKNTFILKRKRSCRIFVGKLFGFPPYAGQKFLYGDRNNQILKKYFFLKSVGDIDIFSSPNLDNIIKNDRNITSQKI